MVFCSDFNSKCNISTGKLDDPDAVLTDTEIGLREYFLVCGN